MSDFLKKLTSRKFIAAATLVIAGLIAMFTDVTPTDATGMVEKYAAYLPQIIGAIMAIAGAIGFIKAEGAVDAANAAK